MSNELYHHGILGMKWGIRRYQPYGEGGYNPKHKGKEIGEAEYAKSIKKKERKAIRKEYKNHPLVLFKTSTGKNYNEAVERFEKQVLSDKQYRELSKKAFNAEKKRLMAEKKYVPNPEEDKLGDTSRYDKYVNSEKAWKLEEESEKATKAKNARLDEMARDFVDQIKDAKLKDIGISDEEKERAKKYISEKFDDFVWDENLEYNNDHYYEPWVDEVKFK